MAEGPHDPGRHRADHGQAALVRVDQDQLADLDVGRQPGDPVDEFRRVGGATAYDRQLHKKASTSAPDCATWQAAS